LLGLPGLVELDGWMALALVWEMLGLEETAIKVDMGYLGDCVRNGATNFALDTKNCALAWAVARGGRAERSGYREWEENGAGPGLSGTIHYLD